MSRKRQRQRQIVVCERAKLYCEQCKQEVYASCITQEWNDHLAHSKVVRPEGNYKRRFVCPYCQAWVGCHKGTYLPLNTIIPTPNLRLGRDLTYRLVVQIGEEFQLKRKEIGVCLGFADYKEIKACNDIEILRKAYKFGLKLRETLRKK